MSKTCTLIDSKGGHFIVFGCDKMTLTNLTISAPEQNRNTDGIKISHKIGINITNVQIGTGDDCVAMISGIKKVGFRIHGISVGRLGANDGETDLEDIVVINCTFNGTSNALRIKTWAAPLNTTLNASSFVYYEDIVMNNVQNPTENSHVQISNVAYKNVRGTSATDNAVNFKCSEVRPYQNITVEDINLWRYVGQKGLGNLSNFCSHVHGASYGKQIPRFCIPLSATPRSAYN
ncbi:hypothetical protein CR513_40235, partial [Mucuna pruriens]